MAIKITALTNGPFMVAGNLDDVQLTDAEGNTFDLSSRPQAYLCRCGASINKPFCDGQHSKIGFEAAGSAVRKA